MTWKYPRHRGPNKARRPPATSQTPAGGAGDALGHPMRVLQVTTAAEDIAAVGPGR